MCLWKVHEKAPASLLCFRLAELRVLAHAETHVVAFSQSFRGKNTSWVFPPSYLPSLCSASHIICNIKQGLRLRGIKKPPHYSIVLESYRTMPPILLVFVLFFAVFEEVQMNHTNDPGPVLQHCTEINIRNGDIGQIDENIHSWVLRAQAQTHTHTCMHMHILHTDPDRQAIIPQLGLL